MRQRRFKSIPSSRIARYRDPNGKRTAKLECHHGTADRVVTTIGYQAGDSPRRRSQYYVINVSGSYLVLRGNKSGFVLNLSLEQLRRHIRFTGDFVDDRVEVLGPDPRAKVPATTFTVRVVSRRCPLAAMFFALN
jgi:hypothetical protein